ncbi:EAL domain-containing protein (putative c-di-GMP-specific phosphodiesterase class I) [Pseudomonas psychrotolerans]|uniref:EAL domain-containing protein (Putative c-di-GMP-specific phosphodiesterase class I) n=1 Tax=Pseudomonas oryzihabitans TaxID=47885 RepID=A0AAJ2BYJ0_9PSED|nr:EAL domain-containing protein (putative c-di-GMP-specific phosphodiesterase class I) [Pseudomonas psychrotolerans]
MNQAIAVKGESPAASGLLITLYNREHLLRAFGEDFAQAAIATLQRQVHLWGASVLALNTDSFLAEPAPAERHDLAALAERWQVALTCTVLEWHSQRALPVIGIRPVRSLMGDDRLDRLHPLHPLSAQDAWPSLRPPPISYGWDWQLTYERDMAIAEDFFALAEQGQAALALQPIARQPRDAQRPQRNPVLYHEALLRWHPDNRRLKDLGPGQVVSALERLGLVRMLDHAVLTTVIDALERRPELHLGCNLSASSLVLDSWWSSPLQRLAQAPAVASRLTVELTESTAVGDMEAALAFTRHLKSLGCQLALDDFGSGYGALGFAMAVPLNVIKLDRSLLHGARGNRSAMEQLQNLSRLCRTLAPKVVAEGVETPQDMHNLRLIELDWAQGFWIGRPLLGEQPLHLRWPERIASNPSMQLIPTDTVPLST